MSKTHVPVLKVENLRTIPPEDNSALKIFVVVKSIFRHLKDSELLNARLVDRQWNFAAMSELVSRRFHLSTIKLHHFSLNEFRGYGWYLKFEKRRRSLGTNLYGTDCPMLEFRHLHFGYTERTEDLQKILRSPWLSCVTILTLSMYSETYEEFVLDWFLPSLPNLQNLSCFIEREIIFGAFPRSGSLGLDQDEARDSRSNNSSDLKLERRDRQMSSKLHSLSICFREACSFPLNLLESFARLQDLKLEFGDAAALIKCAQDMIGTSTALRDIEILEITLTHKPNLKEQVEEAEFNAEALAIASAKMCNQFRVSQSLNVVSMIPAAHFLDFLKELTKTGTKKIKFEIAAPLRKNTTNGHLRLLLCNLIPEILFKFPELEGFHLQFLQYYSKLLLPIHIPWIRPALDPLEPATQQRLKQLHFSTIADNKEISVRQGGSPFPYFRDVHYQRWMMLHTNSWFQGVVELDVQATGWHDCVEIIDVARTTLKCVKKLVFRGMADVYKQRMCSMYFFPKVDRGRFPKRMFNGQEVPRQYEGLPGMKSLEVFRVEQFGIFYNPIVESQIASKMPCLKLIQLDQEFNNVLPANYSYESLYEKFVPRGKITSTWPSSVDHVKILTNNTDGKRCEPCFEVEEAFTLPPGEDRFEGYFAKVKAKASRSKYYLLRDYLYMSQN